MRGMIDMRSNGIKPVLILGVGNILCRDDGAGVHAVRYLQQHPEYAAATIEIIDGGTAGLHLVDFMRNRRRIVIIDAVYGDTPAGTVCVLNPNALTGADAGFSLHGDGVRQCLGELRVRGENPEIAILGVSAADLRAGAIDPTKQVRAAIPRAARLAIEIAVAA
jgi:hydrogenase maturation protease